MTFLTLVSRTALELESVRAPAVLVVVVPVELHQQRLLVEAQSPLLELVDLQQGILGHLQHLHVRSVNRETMSFYQRESLPDRHLVNVRKLLLWSSPSPCIS